MNTQAPEHESTYTVKISYLGKKNPASLSSDVTLNRIIADGREVLGGDVSLSAEKQYFEKQIFADSSISIELFTNNGSGSAQIEVNGNVIRKDLYIANVEAKSWKFDFWLLGSDNQFSVHIPLPRYEINELVLAQRKDIQPVQLDSVFVATPDRGDRHSLLKQPDLLSKKVFTGTSQYQIRYFSWSRFIQQLIFGLLTVWLLSGFYRVYRRSGGIKNILSGQERVFVWFFCGAFFCYLIWLLIFWPGVMSVDSLKIWRAAQLPEVYLNDHPILNVFLYKFLYHVWNSPAVVPLFHVAATSTLVATVFYTIQRNHVPVWLLMPFYLLTVLSIPIGLYNTVLWKDIPFALLIVFWGYISVMLFQKKQLNSLHLSREQVVVLILLLLSLGFIRHNGLIYLIFIPFFYVLLGLIRLNRRIVFGVACGGVLTIAGITFLTGILATDSGYLITQGKMYMQYVLRSSPSALLQQTWQNYWGILDINQTTTKWDLYHYFLGDRYAYKFLQHAGWHDVYPYLQNWSGPLASLKDLAMAVYWRSYQVPFVYFSWNPFWALALFPLCVIAFRWLPFSAIFSSVVLAQVLTLTTLLNVMNWRYYYFVCIASCFIIPMICFDIARKVHRNRNEI